MLLLPRTVLSYIPPTLGSTVDQVVPFVVVPTWCPASVIPQSYALAEGVVALYQVPVGRPVLVGEQDASAVAGDIVVHHRRIIGREKVDPFSTVARLDAHSVPLRIGESEITAPVGLPPSLAMTVFPLIVTSLIVPEVLVRMRNTGPGKRAKRPQFRLCRKRAAFRGLR